MILITLVNLRRNVVLDRSIVPIVSRLPIGVLNRRRWTSGCPSGRGGRPASSPSSSTPLASIDATSTSPARGSTRKSSLSRDHLLSTVSDSSHSSPSSLSWGRIRLQSSSLSLHLPVMFESSQAGISPKSFVSISSERMPGRRTRVIAPDARNTLRVSPFTLTNGCVSPDSNSWLGLLALLTSSSRSSAYLILSLGQSRSGASLLFRQEAGQLASCARGESCLNMLSVGNKIIFSTSLWLYPCLRAMLKKRLRKLRPVFLMLPGE
mmetsp:Transcript_10317/g.23593  ORF Transcript_10317/g.23593 Transcript_10317/m.23593 type:complete len:265 (+) Transcript_10317:975-1769(+)